MSASELTQEEILRYSRHLLIPEVGLEGQRRLKAASVLIVGSGGLGSPISLYLAAAGIGRLGMVDYDVVESSNLQRQIVHGTSRVGAAKVDSARARLLELNPYIQVDTWNEAFTVENAEKISEGFDILVDGTDNFATRYLLNDLAVLTGRPFVYGSIYRFEGQVSVFDARRGPCYRCLFPEAPPAGLVPSCAEGGVFGVLPGTIGTLQATEVIKLALGIGMPLYGRLVLFDALESVFHTIQLKKNPACKICGEKPSITRLSEDAEACAPYRVDAEIDNLPSIWKITPQELALSLKQSRPPRLIDVREPVEQQVSALPGAVVIPFLELARRVKDLDPDDEYVAICRTGTRSARAVIQMRASGYAKTRYLAGGLNAWAAQIDPSMLKY